MLNHDVDTAYKAGESFAVTVIIKFELNPYASEIMSPVPGVPEKVLVVASNFNQNAPVLKRTTLL